MTNQEESTRVLTKLLKDEIPEEDAFGGHEKVADAIHGLINDEEKGGKAIALSGGFGSGKSTVIDFLKRKFKKEEDETNQETGFFIFDAWEHQGNPLRRAFIEKYINFLSNEVGWANEKEYKEQLELVSKNREDIDTTTEPFLTKLGGWFALILLLIPLGLGLTRLGMIENSHVLLFWLGVAFLVLPFLYTFGVYACWRPYREKQRKRIKNRLNLKEWKWKYFFTHNRTPFHRKSIFTFFSKKSREKIKSTSLKSPDPTTIEFQSVFNTITSEVLENKERRLIVVIDNIDRLTTNSSIDAWTTLRAFFENDNEDWTWKDQFWLIAPFDLRELKNLWGGLDHLNIPKNSGESDDTSEYVQAFIDKTFQITFRVPQPVLSDWKQFFKDKLCKAFPTVKEEKQEVFNDIATLYQLKGITGTKSPTPRDIKQFINRVGALYRIWFNEDIKLSLLAYYELLISKDEENIVNKLKEDKLVDSTAKVILNEEDLNKKLAAIHFNCESDKAYQVLYGNEVVTALQNGNANGLENYYETDGFIDVLNSEFTELAGQDKPLTLSNCALSLNEIEENSEHDFNRFFQRLSSSFSSVTAISPDNENIGKGIKVIWKQIGFKNEWMVSILKSISGDKIDGKETSIESWYTTLEPIFTTLSEQNKVQLLEDNLEMPGEAEDYVVALSLINKLDEAKKEIATYLLPDMNSNEIVEAFSELLNSEEMPDDLGSVMYLLFLIKERNIKDWDWSNLVDRIQRTIKVDSDADSEQVEAAVKIMFVLCLKLDNQKAKDLSENDNFKDGLFYLIDNTNENLLGLLVLAVCLFNPINNVSNNTNEVRSGQKTFNDILQNSGDKEFIEKDLIKYLIDFRILDDFLRVQHDNNLLKTLSKKVMELSFDSDEARKLINSEKVFKYFSDFYQQVKEASFLNHLESLFDWEDSLVEQIVDKFDNVLSNHQLHYCFAKACPENLRESYFYFLTQNLKEIEQDQWLEHLKNETELIELIIFMQQFGYDLGLSVELRKALFEHFKELYDEDLNISSNYLKTNWNSILNSLKNDVKLTLLRNIRDHIVNYEGSIANVGAIYDTAFIKNEILLEDAERFVRIVFARILENRDGSDLKWINNLLQTDPHILEKADAAAENFKEDIVNLQEEDLTDEVWDIVQKIKQHPNIDKKNGSEEKPNEEE